jgi:PTS system cellobiose-specific IIB component
MCAKKMAAAAKEMGIEAEIAAYSFTQLDNLVEQMDVFLISPQTSFKLEAMKNTYAQHVHKFSLLNPMDFGMMDGAKILKAAIGVVDKYRQN